MSPPGPPGRCLRTHHRPRTAPVPHVGRRHGIGAHLERRRRPNGPRPGGVRRRPRGVLRPAPAPRRAPRPPGRWSRVPAGPSCGVAGGRPCGTGPGRGLDVGHHAGGDGAVVQEVTAVDGQQLAGDHAGGL
ncbi:hypothetical protein ACFFX0_20805 [Citricoccus parietis]|uniref:Uncharacterized protein n=1 Tax=Citricoccus parietis TaxID=592307 RepID=A0ABV5G3J5_9MICC